ncbi:MAG: MotA/TolQ/ExbB proton channel family protein [Gammaproteobacteria bacterium]|nr:MotA/TolQ/ExbB proton channel family protein [Gammaproteobacteria bacterium]NNC97965.1 MotA/TolQ/ExbB proton channel family protein [Gammaproteobacteria bacterium]NNM13772.1 MotA/TolQ/ExbB proton channel family protein [Gammaproteobacteria bacterium]
MWACIFERMFYLTSVHPKNVKAAMDHWNAREDHGSWYAHQVRERMISVVSQGLDKRVEIIQTCVALCPLLGLLGTVTGMIEVFSSMSDTGAGSARTMASGVAKATVPTMAGMVAAISGVAVAAYFKRKAAAEREELGEHLELADWEGH